jgi:hypothetical protein
MVGKKFYRKKSVTYMFNIEHRNKLKFLRSAHIPETEEQEKQHLEWFKDEEFRRVSTNADVPFDHWAEVLVAVLCHMGQTN